MNSTPPTFARSHFMDDPYATYAKLREEMPVFHDTVINVYHVTSFALIKYVLDNYELFSSEPNTDVMTLVSNDADIIDLYESEGALPPVAVLIMSDPPEHGRMRSVVEKVVTAGAIRKMAGSIEAIANQLVKSFPENGMVDFHQAFSRSLPLFTMADLLGVSRNHADLLHRMADSTTALADGGTRSRDKILNLHRVQIEGQKVMQRMIEFYRGNPLDNIISHLATAQFDDASNLSDTQIHALIQLLLVGGNDTSVGALSNAMLYLARHPEIQTVLQADHSLIGRFVEEAVRFDSPVAGLYRFAKRDVELGGVIIPAGATVSCRLNAGNRDPNQFPNADEIDLQRKAIRNHVGFGAGIHYCVGAHLGRAEVNIGLQVVLSQLGNIRLQNPDEPIIYEDKLVVRNPMSVSIMFDRL
jgi:cytochrome P450